MGVKEYAKALIDRDPFYKDLAEQKELCWINDKYGEVDFKIPAVSLADIKEAEARLERFAPYIAKCFPETAEDGGLIESPLREISSMRAALEETYQTEIPGRLFLKMDSHLAIAGSVKARGGIYEVLKHAEDLALCAGLITETDDYSRFADPDIKEFFGRFTIQVGSTGNLGLSIGIMSAHLGFKVKVHMSADARQWKKELLRSKGVEVIEYEEDYSKAVAEGRKDSDADPMSYFVDDENSKDLFLGYAVAAGRLQTQLIEQDIFVDNEHPLFVYIPCGVGGAPGGICYGLKKIFGKNVHVFFCEPTRYPSVLLGMATGMYNEVNVNDFGLGGISAADGLACASPSGFVTRIDRTLLSGDFTVKDKELFDHLRLLKETEDIFIEPSACAAFQGPVKLLAESAGCSETSSGCKISSGGDYLAAQGIDMTILSKATQICWATGGKLVPEEIREQYLKTY